MRFVIFQDVNSLWYWELRSNDETVLAASPRGYLSRDDALHSIDSVRKNVGHAGIFDRAGNLEPGF